MSGSSWAEEPAFPEPNDAGIQEGRHAAAHMDYETLQRRMNTTNERLLATYRDDPNHTLQEVLLSSRICDANEDAHKVDVISTLMAAEYDRLKLQVRSFDEKTACGLDHEIKSAEQTVFDLYQKDPAYILDKRFLAVACLAGDRCRFSMDLIDQGVFRLQARGFEVYDLRQW